MKIPFKDELISSVVQLPNWVLVSKTMLSCVMVNFILCYACRHTNNSKRKQLIRPEMHLMSHQLQMVIKNNGLLEKHHMTNT